MSWQQKILSYEIQMKMRQMWCFASLTGIPCNKRRVATSHNLWSGDCSVLHPDMWTPVLSLHIVIKVSVSMFMGRTFDFNPLHFIESYQQRTIFTMPFAIIQWVQQKQDHLVSCCGLMRSCLSCWPTSITCLLPTFMSCSTTSSSCSTSALDTPPDLIKPFYYHGCKFLGNRCWYSKLCFAPLIYWMPPPPCKNEIVPD